MCLFQFKDNSVGSFPPKTDSSSFTQKLKIRTSFVVSLFISTSPIITMTVIDALTHSACASGGGGSGGGGILGGIGLDDSQTIGQGGVGATSGNASPGIDGMLNGVASAATGGAGGTGSTGANHGMSGQPVLSLTAGGTFTNSDITVGGGAGGGGAATDGSVGANGGFSLYTIAISTSPCLLTNTATGVIVGGGGGGGGTANTPASSGTGGVGGSGIFNSAANTNIQNQGLITGGGGGGAGSNSKAGGAGGDGLSLNGLTSITNSGTIQGGNGGQGGTPGAGGIGINWTGVPVVMTIINSGTISGGLSGDGATRAAAIRFNGTGSSLELQSGYNIIGDVIGGTNNILTFGGSSSVSFDLSEIGSKYQNFTTFNKTGSSTWTLTNSPGTSTPWNISAGTLQFGNGTTDGTVSGNITNNGALVFNQNVADAIYADAITGSGTFTKMGSRTLSLTSTGSAVTGDVTVSDGTLALNQASGNFTASTYTNNAGTTIAATTQLVPVTYTQGVGGTLTLDYSNASASIASTNTTLAGTLVINNFTSGALPTTASALIQKSIITSTNNISGDFTVKPTAATSLDYIFGNTAKSADQKSYTAGLALAWNSASTVAHGTFTTTSDFTVDTVLANMTGPFTSGWNGQSLTKAGTATLILTGANTYTGGNTVTAGLLQFGDGATAPTSIGNIANTGGVVFNLPSDMTYSNTISGTGGTFRQSGANVTFVANQTYTGKTTIDATRTLILGNGGTGGTVASTLITNNGTLTINRSNAVTLAAAIDGSGNLVKQGANVLTLSGASSYTGGTSINGGTISVSADNNLGDASGGLVFNGGTLQVTGTSYTTMPGTRAITWDGTNGGAFDIASAANIFTISSDFGGSTGPISKKGPGSLLLSGARNASGAVDVQGGSVIIDNNASLGSGTVTFAANTGLKFNNNITNFANNLIVNGAFSIDNLGHTGTVSSNITTGTSPTLTVTDTTATAASKTIFTGTISAPVVVSNTLFQMGDGTTTGNLNNNVNLATANSGIIFNGALNDDFTFSHIISGAGSFTQAGSNTITITGVNTYTGTTTIKNGSRIILGSGGSLGTGAIIVETGGRYDVSVQATDVNLGNVTLNPGSTLQIGDKNVGLESGTIAGDIADAGSSSGLTGGKLVKTSSGILELLGMNTYSGGTVLNGGVIAISDNGALGTGQLTMAAGTTLQTTTTMGGAIANDVVLTSGTATLDTNGQANTISGDITGAGALTLTDTSNSGTGQITLTSAANTYSGATTINSAKLIASAANTLSPNSPLVLADNVAANLEISGNQSVPSLSGGGTSGGNILINAAATLTISGTTNTVYSGQISGLGGLIKDGSSQLSIAGNQTYTGATTINGGELKFNGTGASAITIGANGIFSGTNTIPSLTSSGIIAPGNSIGTITVGTLNLNPSSVYTCEVSANGTSDKIVVTTAVVDGDGIATLAGKVNAIPEAGSYQRGTIYRYTILTADGGPIVGGFDPNVISPSSRMYSFSLDPQATQIDLLVEKTASFSDLAPDGNANHVANALDVIESQGVTGSLQEALTAVQALDGLDLSNALNRFDAAENTMLQSVIAHATFDNWNSVLAGIDHNLLKEDEPVIMEFNQLIAQNQIPIKAKISNSKPVRGFSKAFRGLYNVLPETGQLPNTFRANIGNLSIWGKGSGRMSTEDTFIALGTNIPGMKTISGGANAGVDYKVSDKLLIGITGGYTYTDYRFHQNVGDGDVSSYQLGVYGSLQPVKNWYIDATFGYGFNHFKGKRKIKFANFNRQVFQRHNGQQIGALAETGYDIKLNNKIFLTPLLGFGILYQNELRYREMGADNLGLDIRSQRSTFYQTKAGAQLAKLFIKGDTQFYAYAKLTYDHTNSFGRQKLGMSFNGSGNRFKVYGSNKPSNQVSPGVGVATVFKSNVYLTLDYKGSFGRNQRSHEAFLKIGKKF